MNTQFDHFVTKVASTAILVDMAERCSLEVEHSRGRRPIALCPYHDDHRPSLYIYEKEGTTARDQFHCFACGAHGDVFTLVGTLRNVDFWQAATWVAEQYGIPVPRGGRGKRTAKPPRIRGLEEALVIYRSQADAEVRRQEAIARDRGFATDFLAKSEVFFARGNKISGSVDQDDERDRVEALREAGVIRHREPRYLPQEAAHLKITFPLKDLFLGDRLVFTIRDQNGELVGFAGRDAQDQGPKYLFTESFPRRSTLYGLNRVFGEVRKLKPPRTRKKASKSENPPVFHLFLVEGLFDVLRLESFGLFAAGILGSRLTEKQAELIGQLASEVDRREWQLAVHLFLDDDDAGRGGAAAAIPRLLHTAANETAFGLDVIVPTHDTPSAAANQLLGSDPDDLLLEADDQRSATDLLESWNHSALAFLLAEGIGVSVGNLDAEWPMVIAGVRQRACRQLERQLDDEVWNRVFARLLPFDTWLTASRQASSSWQTDVERFISSPSIDKPRTSADEKPYSLVRNLAEENQLLHALQVAEASTQRREVPVDEGSWTRLKVAWDVAALSLIDQVADADRRPEPMMAINVPRLDGRFRLKALPHPEDLTIQQYVLNELLCGRESPDFLDAIPAVRFSTGVGRGTITTTGIESLLPANSRTVSFAYQVDMDVVEGVLPPRREGMFRPYYKCWCDFISFIDQRVAESRLTTFHVARLDIRKYYDMLPRHAVHDVLFRCVKRALDSLSRLGGPGPRACAPLLDVFAPDQAKDDPDVRARRIVDWMCDQSFGYRYLSPSDGTIVESQPLERGLPQGPDLSAYLANVALFKLDHVLSHAANEAEAVYARYVDDMVIVAPSASILGRLRGLIEDELSRLGLELNSKSERLPPMSIGQLREWLTDSRGGLGVSGPFAGPPINEPLASLQPLADAGEIDRADALSLLHDNRLVDPNTDIDDVLKTISIARAASDLRYGEYVKAAQVLWARSVPQGVEGVTAGGDERLASAFISNWKDTGDLRELHRVDLSNVEAPGYWAMTCLLAWLDGLESFLRRRYDQFADLSSEAKRGLLEKQRLLAIQVGHGLCRTLRQAAFLEADTYSLRDHEHVLQVKELLIYIAAGDVAGIDPAQRVVPHLPQPSSHAQLRIQVSLAAQRRKAGLIDNLAARSLGNDGWTRLRTCFHESLARMNAARTAKAAETADEAGFFDPLQAMVQQYADLKLSISREIGASSLARVLNLWLPHATPTIKAAQKNLDDNRLAIRAARALIQSSPDPADMLGRRSLLADVVLNATRTENYIEYLPEPAGIGVPGILGIEVAESSQPQNVLRIACEHPAVCAPTSLEWQKTNDDDFDRYQAPLKPYKRLIPPGGGEGDPPRTSLFDRQDKIPAWLADAFEAVVKFLSSERSSNLVDGDASSQVFPPTATNLLCEKASRRRPPLPAAVLAHAVGPNRIGAQAFRRMGSRSLIAEPINANHAELWRVGTALADFLGYLDTKNDSVLLRSDGSNENDDQAEWAVDTLLRLALRRLRGFSLPARELPVDDDSQLGLPRTVSRTLRCLRDFPADRNDNRETRLTYLLGCLAENRAFESRFDDHFGLSDRSESGTAVALLSEIARRLFRADEGLADELPTTAAEPSHPRNRRPVLAWHQLAERLYQLRTMAADKSRDALDPLIASCRLASVVTQMKMQVLELWSTLPPDEQRRYQDAPLNLATWNLDEFAHLHLSQSESREIDSTVPSSAKRSSNVSLVFGELLSISEGRAANERLAMDRITPLGWCIALGTLVGVIRTKTQTALTHLYRPDSDDEAASLSNDFSFLSRCLAEEWERNDDLPWGDLRQVVAVWSDASKLDQMWGLLETVDRICGLVVTTHESPHFMISDGRGKTRNVRTSIGTRNLLAWQIVGASALREKRNHGVEVVRAEDGQELIYRWSETWHNDRIVSIGTVHSGLARLSGLQMFNETPEPSKLHKEKYDDATKDVPTFPNRSDEATPEKPVKASSDFGMKSNRLIRPGAPDAATKSGSGQDEGIKWVERVQEISWSRRAKLDSHLRVAFLQLEVDDSYRHPLFDVCVEDAIEEIAVSEVLRSALDTGKHHHWDATSAEKQYESKKPGLPSCAEHRRRKLIGRALHACKTMQVDVLLLPEYSVRPETIDWMQREVREQAIKTFVWAGTFRFPPGMRNVTSHHPCADPTGTSSDGDYRPWASVLSLVTADPKRNAWRKKKYPSVALGEQFAPATGGIEPLIGNDCEGLRTKVIELICSEAFIATSPSNLLSEAYAYRRLLQKFGMSLEGDVLKTAQKNVVEDIVAFAEHTSMCGDPLRRKSIVLVPAMSSRAVDYAVLGQASYLAAGLTTVFCNAAGPAGRGQSCFIGHDGWDKQKIQGSGYPLGQPYHGEFPGIYKPSNEDRGWLGEREQALVVADIDPFYSTEGKPRPQMLPPPLTLIAHLPIIESWQTPNRPPTDRPACRCGHSRSNLNSAKDATTVREIVAEIRAAVENRPYTNTADDKRPEILAKPLRKLAKIAGRGKSSDYWLTKRANAYLAEHSADPTEWPPPVCLDWLFVELGDTTEVNRTRIEVPAYSAVTGDRP